MSKLPTDNLVAHFDADALRSDHVDGDPVDTWPNPVGAEDAVQATGADQPEFEAEALDGRAGVLFGGADEHMTVDNYAALDMDSYTIGINYGSTGGDGNILTIINKQDPENGANDRTFWVSIDDGQDAVGIGHLWWRMSSSGNNINLDSGESTTDGDLHIATLRTEEGESAEMRLDGVEVDSRSNPGPANGDGEDIGIGQDLSVGGDRYFNGTMAEILIYDAALSDDEVLNLESYLEGGPIWESLDPLPNGHWDHGMAGLGGDIYIMGGADPGDSFSPSDTVDIYHPDTATFSTADTLPADSRLVAAASNGETIYAVGTPTGTTFGADLWSYEPDLWIVESTLPAGRRRTSLAASGSFVAVVAGAVDGGNGDEVDIYEIGSGTWTDSTTFPGGEVELPGSTIWDGWLYVAGGDTDAGDGDEMYRYDLENEGPWEFVIGGDPAVTGEKVGMDGDHGYIWLDQWGGANDARAWRYSVPHDELIEVDTLPDGGIANYSGTFHDGVYYISGGTDVDGDAFYALEQAVPTAPSDLEGLYHG